MNDHNPSAFPGNPWTSNFLVVVVVASVIASSLLSAKQSSFDALGAICALASGVLAVLAWNRFAALRQNRVDPQPPLKTSSGLAYLLLGGSLLASAVGLFRVNAGAPEWIVLILPYLCIALYHEVLSRNRFSLLIVASLLMGLLFLVVAAIHGNIAVGGFPAVLAALLTFILLTTRELESRTPVPDESSADPHVHLLHHRALAWLSVVFFLFGVVAFWPWLGKLYGDTYFWVMALGVLMPLLYLWGRLRQPRRQNSYVALLRFNRLIPYLGFVLLIAIALG